MKKLLLPYLCLFGILAFMLVRLIYDIQEIIEYNSAWFVLLIIVLFLVIITISVLFFISDYKKLKK